jgi:hypothetical protein
MVYQVKILINKRLNKNVGVVIQLVDGITRSEKLGLDFQLHGVM